MILLIIQFMACAAVIGVAGVFLVKYGDAIAERLHLGRLWAGAILVATATSLPELVSGMGSVLIFDIPDLAVSTLLGSCIFNLLLLVMLDFLFGKASFFDGVNPAYIVESAFAILLIWIFALGFVFSPRMAAFPWIWPGSILAAVVYVVAVYITLREGRNPPYVQDLDMHADTSPQRKPRTRAGRKNPGIPELRVAIPGYAVSAILVVAAALWLPGISEKIADKAGIGTTVLGGIAVALTTSLPEIITTLAAFRIGAADMAFSNVMGSNLFNIFILAVEDGVYLKGPITSHASPVNLMTAVIAMGMTAVVIAALAVRKQRKFLRLSTASWALIAGFLLNAAALSLLG